MIAPRPAGRETTVRESQMSVRNRAIWNARQREIYAEFGRLPLPEADLRGQKRGASVQRDAVGAWLAARCGQLVRSGDVGRAIDRDSSHVYMWLKHFEARGLVRQVRRGVWLVLGEGG